MKPCTMEWILSNTLKDGWFVAKKNKEEAGVYVTSGGNANLWNWKSTDEKITAKLKPLSDSTKDCISVYVNPLGFYEEGVRLLRKAGYSIHQQHPPDGWEEHDPKAVY